MSVIKFIDPKLETITINVQLDVGTVALLNKFISLNRSTKNTHGPMSLDKLVSGSKMWPRPSRIIRPGRVDMQRWC
jgi:hypothetical protein